MDNESKFISFLRTLKEYNQSGKIASFFIVGVSGVLAIFQLIDVVFLSIAIGMGFGFYSFFFQRDKKSGRKLNLVSGISPVKRENIAQEIVDDLLKKISKKDSRIHIVIGSSGAGKSTILRENIKVQLENGKKNAKVFMFDNYKGILGKLIESLGEYYKKAVGVNRFSDLVKKIPSRDFVVFAFDQFENIFLLDPKQARNQLLVMCEVIDYCAKTRNRRCILVLRKEWFYCLRFFGQNIPHLSKVHVIEGFDKKREGKSFEDLLKLVEEILPLDPEEIVNDCIKSGEAENYYTQSCLDLSQLKNQHILETESERNLGQVLPVQLQVVVDALLYRHRINPIKHGEWKKIGVDGAIRYYFEAHIQKYASEIKDVDFKVAKMDAARVLFALSINPRSRYPLTRLELKGILNISSQRIDTVIEYFVASKHLQMLSGERYSWMHDFYAEKFNEVSGIFLDPIDRDNINLLCDRLKQQSLNSSKNNSTRVHSDAGGNVMENFGQSDVNVKEEMFGIILFSVSVLFLLFRTFIPPLTEWFTALIGLVGWPRRLVLANGSFAPHFDILFLPIAISLTCWSWYVTTWYRRLLANLVEDKGSKAFSRFVAIWSFICVVLTITFPTFWLGFTGIGGLLVGIKYGFLAKVTKNKLNKTRFGKMGWETILNSFFLLPFGITFVLMFPPNSFLAKPEDWILITVSYISMIIMLYFAYVSSQNHISETEVPILIGTYKRYKYY